jgi:hypothetical protein
MDLRNKLVVSEAFKAYLDAFIEDGKIAERDFEEEKAREAYSHQNDWYKGL